MGLVKTRRLAAMHHPSPAATEDNEAAAREGGDAPAVQGPIPVATKAPCRS